MLSLVRGDALELMARPKKYPDELIQRGIRLALESERPIAHIAADMGMHPETLRKKVRQAEADSGARPECCRVLSVRRSGGCARRTTSCAARTRSSSRRRCISRRSSTQTERSERVYRSAARALRGRADLPGPGRVGVRVLPTRHGSALDPCRRGRAAARAHLRASRCELLRLTDPGECGRRCDVPASRSAAGGWSGSCAPTGSVALSGPRRTGAGRVARCEPVFAQTKHNRADATEANRVFAK